MKYIFVLYKKKSKCSTPFYLAYSKNKGSVYPSHSVVNAIDFSFSEASKVFDVMEKIGFTQFYDVIVVPFGY